MDRIDAMRAFVRVVETGSFTKAAETLQVSRASVTHLVQQLEAHLRVTLFHRTTRKVNVTADGAGYYERVIRLLADLDDAETSLATESLSPRGRLRVDVPAPLASLVLVPALPGFHARYPDIQIDLGASDRRVDLLADNVDCVIRGGEITEHFLRARRIADLPLGVYAAPAYLRRVGTPTYPGELKDGDHRIVGYRTRTGALLPTTLRRGDELLQLTGRYVLSVDDGNSFLAAGVAGFGVLCVPHFMAHAPLLRGELVPLFEDWHVDPMPLSLAYPPNRHVSRKLRVFIDWVAELLAADALGIDAPDPSTGSIPRGQDIHSASRTP